MTRVGLLDISSSMAEFVGLTGRTRHDMLQQAVSNAALHMQGAIWLAYNDTVQLIERPQDGLPSPEGGTDLTGAFWYAARYGPDLALVISDGRPKDARSALTAALLLGCKISTIYCGDESDRKAIAFMRDLANCSRAGLLGSAKVTSLAAPEEVAKQILQLVGPS